MPKPILSRRFLSAFSDAADEDAVGNAQSGASAWTSIMFKRIHKAATMMSLGMCSNKMEAPSRPGDWKHGWRKEFLFDITLFRQADWEKEWVKPEIIIEHENSWSEPVFLDDLWKLQVGFAPLRIMFGYHRTSDSVKKYITKANSVFRSWTTPSGTEDLILLGYEGMQSRFLVYERIDGEWIALPAE